MWYSDVDAVDIVARRRDREPPGIFTPTNIDSFLYKLCFAASILQIQEYLCTLSKNRYYYYALICIIFC